MTSTPVSASTSSFYFGTSAAVTSTETDVNSNFSETFKNQRSNQATKEVEPEQHNGTGCKNLRKNEDGKRITKQEGKKTISEDTNVDAEEVSKIAESQIVSTVAEELAIEPEKVSEILESLSMTPLDLLQGDHLQQVVLAALGESDPISLTTNEALFQSFKDVSESLSEVISEVATQTGLSEDAVKQMIEEQLKPDNENLKNNTVEDEIQKTPDEAFHNVLTEVANDGMKETIKVKTDETSKEVEPAEGKQSSQTNETQILKTPARDEKHSATEQNQSNDNQNNPYMDGQNKFVNEVVKTETQPMRSFEPETERIMNQITDYMKSQVMDGTSELEMKLHPESLGTLHVKLTSRDGMITAKFTAENETVKTALENQMVTLKETFKEQGVSVEAIEVSVESHRFDESFQQSRNGNMQEESRQPQNRRTRRINLNAITEEEELTEEEALAATMLKSNGNTVDYQA